jgi:hypothetical protein
MPSAEDLGENYRLVRKAIARKQQVLAFYRGYYREMCPFLIGISRHGRLQALFYQFAGESSQQIGPPGSPDNWRCIAVDELEDVRLRDGDWHSAPNHTRPETCVFQRLDLSDTP